MNFLIVLFALMAAALAVPQYYGYSVGYPSYYGAGYPSYYGAEYPSYYGGGYFSNPEDSQESYESDEGQECK
ncbi:keratin-associated protein 21-1-like [Drosophila miranda]|uniref:keratin-associated protein 21-1-like n=1 Tax=Drosophila miranda TaxID=7229 RepID=UPI0007E63181|nr:keratin-associated protein 21-1-like [Drosophila miranda]